MIRVRLSSGLAALLAAGVVAGCGGRTVQDTFGYQRRAPDEFAVVRRAPLIIPPDYQLRPPQPGIEGPQTTSSSAETFAALTGQPPVVERQLSPAEESLLAAAPGQSIPNIRQVIASEGPQTAVLDRGNFLFILSWQRASFDAEAAQRELLDPVLESQRLRGEGIVQTARVASTPVTQ